MIGWEEVGEVGEVVVGDFTGGAVDEHHARGGAVLERAGGDELLISIIR